MGGLRERDGKSLLTSVVRYTAVVYGVFSGTGITLCKCFVKIIEKICILEGGMGSPSPTFYQRPDWPSLIRLGIFFGATVGDGHP